MFNNESRVVDNFAPPKGIVALMEVDDNIDGDDDDEADIDDDVKFVIDLIIPELGAKP